MKQPARKSHACFPLSASGRVYSRRDSLRDRPKRRRRPSWSLLASGARSSPKLFSGISEFMIASCDSWVIPVMLLFQVGRNGSYIQNSILLDFFFPLQVGCPAASRGGADIRPLSRPSFPRPALASRIMHLGPFSVPSESVLCRLVALRLLSFAL